MTYYLYDEDIYDAPIKTQITQKIIVSGEITADGLMDLLDGIYREQHRRAGFQYHRNPTNITIWAYLDEDRAASGPQWIAMLDKMPDSQVSITVKEDTVARLSDPEVERFGLSEKQRIEVYRKVCRLGGVAREEAEERYPTNLPQSLKIGDQFKLTRETSLMPEFEPTDFSAAMSQIRQIPPGATIEIIKVRKKNDTPWYFAEVFTGAARWGRGWINSIALLGQDQEDIKQRIASNQQTLEQLADKYWSELADKYGLTRDQLDEIWAEGVSKDWPDTQAD